MKTLLILMVTFFVGQATGSEPICYLLTQDVAVRESSSRVVSLAASTLVLRRPATEQRANQYMVSTIGSPPVSGWIPTSLLTQLTGRAGGNPQVPVLLEAQPDQVRAAWIEVQQAVLESERRGLNMPEPYIARSQIWAAVHNYDEAIQDILRAASAIKAQGRTDAATLSRYFSILHASLERYSRLPRPPHPGVANSHYAAGLRAFFGGDLTTAERRFSDAIALSPQEPVYYYLRALTHRRQGLLEEATRDARVGGHYESRSAVRASRVDFALQRIQGSSRTWLESFRIGDPHFDPRADMTLPPGLRPANRARNQSPQRQPSEG